MPKVPMDINDLPYRLKSARRKKRIVKEAFDKKLIRLDKLQHDLSLQKKALPWITLSQPYQKGWKRIFMLTAKEKRGPKAQFYSALLEKINFTVYHYDETFKVKNKRKAVYDYLERPQLLREFSLYEWHTNKMELTYEEKELFERKETWNEQYRKMIGRYVFTEPWRFELTVKPHFIHQVKQVDEMIERQISLVDDFINWNHYYPRIQKIKDRTYHRWDWDYFEQIKYPNELKNNPKYSSKEAYFDQ